MKNRIFTIALLLSVICFDRVFGQNVGIGEPNPGSKLSVKGGMSVGSGYSGLTAPTGGLIIEGVMGLGTTTPDSNAVLDIASTTKGIKFPRLSQAARTAITNPSKGLVVFDSDSNSIYFHTGSQWQSLVNLSQVTNIVNSAVSGLLGGGSGTGSTWYTGSGAPSALTGVTNDMYLNTANSDYYQKTSSVAWTLKGNLTGQGYGSTSTTGVTIGTGSKTFTTQANQAYQTDDRIRASAGTSTYMEGLVTSYSGTSLVINVTRVVGSGTFSTWNIGLIGDVGATGATGTNGTNGATGAAGVAGTNGTSGATGATGAAGTNGTNGAAGATGAQGIQGLQGVAGPTGAAGAAGAIGATGLKGATGSNGVTGAAGAAGTTGASSAWLSGMGNIGNGVGNVGDWYIRLTTGDIFQKTGNLTWTEQMNIMGPTGATGSNGTNGAIGATGAQGIQGLAGPTGAAGTNGTNGTNGAAGPTGAQGIQGVAGATGAVGPTGAAGVAGWSLTGNSINAGTNFIGTTNNTSFRIRTNNAARAVIDSLGNFGIGTTSPKNKLDVNGGIAVGTYAGAAALSDGILVSGDVGIGTNGDYAPLTLQASGGKPVLLGGGSSTGSELKLLSFGTEHFSIYNSGAANALGNYYMSFANTSALAQTNTAGSSLMVIDQNGSVGIGTTSPDNMLHVYTPYDADGMLVDGSQSVAVMLANGGTMKAAMSLAYGTGSWSTDAATNDMVIRTQANTQKILFNTNGGSGASTMAINSGSVGIGTIAPKSKLDVNGGISVGSYAGSVSAPANGLIVSGNVGFGTSSPNSAFEVDGGFGSKVTTITVSTSTTLDNTAFIWYFTGTGSVVLPSASSCTYRRYWIVNKTSAAKTISSYAPLSSSATATSIGAYTSIEVISNGTTWLQIK